MPEATRSRMSAGPALHSGVRDGAHHTEASHLGRHAQRQGARARRRGVQAERSARNPKDSAPEITTSLAETESHRSDRSLVQGVGQSSYAYEHVTTAPKGDRDFVLTPSRRSAPLRRSTAASGSSRSHATIAILGGCVLDVCGGPRQRPSLAPGRRRRARFVRPARPPRAAEAARSIPASGTATRSSTCQSSQSSEAPSTLRRRPDGYAPECARGPSGPPETRPGVKPNGFAPGTASRPGVR